jgi:phage-related baseplate assembly protein
VNDVEQVIARATTDAAFRRRLVDDPRAALAGYTLSTSGLRRVADALADGPAGHAGSSVRTLLTRSSEGTDEVQSHDPGGLRNA